MTEDAEIPKIPKGMPKKNRCPKFIGACPNPTDLNANDFPLYKNLRKSNKLCENERLIKVVCGKYKCPRSNTSCPECNFTKYVYLGKEMRSRDSQKSQKIKALYTNMYVSRPVIETVPKVSKTDVQYQNGYYAGYDYDDESYGNPYWYSEDNYEFPNDKFKAGFEAGRFDAELNAGHFTTEVYSPKFLE